jgi:hypothetical protein
MEFVAWQEEQGLKPAAFFGRICGTTESRALTLLASPHEFFRSLLKLKVADGRGQRKETTARA